MSVLSEERLEKILSHLPGLKLAVVGDFFLDRYLEIDPLLSERSLETGLEAYQIIRKRPEPGAAGTVSRNLASLGVGTIFAVGITGRDGEGFELRESLQKWSVDLSHLIETPDRFTPTYMKPLRTGHDRPPEEMNRLDIKNRKPITDTLEKEILARLEELTSEVSGVILLDQVTEENCGVLSNQVIRGVKSLAARHPDKTFMADSRSRIGKFRGCTLKLNQREATLVFEPDTNTEAPLARVQEYAARLAQESEKPVFLTLGAGGVLAAWQRTVSHVKTIDLAPPLDIVGAGDSATAGIISAICSGGSVEEAAALANIVASVTVQQIGTTGYAAPAQVRNRWKEFQASGVL